MSLYISGFIAALVVSAFVLIWIAYCMFIKERYKSEVFHHSIADLKRKNQILSQDCSSYSVQSEEKEPKKKEITAAVFVLPSRHKNKHTYDQRPDYPESPSPFSHHSTNQLIDILDNVGADVHSDGLYQIDSCPPGDSDV